MKRLHIRPSWFFVLIPLGMLFFVVGPELEQKYDDYQDRAERLQDDEKQLEALQALEQLDKREKRRLASLEHDVRFARIRLGKLKFLYAKTGGMLGLLALMGLGMFTASVFARMRKGDRLKELGHLAFDAPDTLGRSISWDPVSGSGSNFGSETLKKTANGFKVGSSGMVKIVAWAFFLVGLNYLAWSFVEFYSLNEQSLGFMKAGKMFFTSGGPFLMVGLFLIAYASPKAYILTGKRKVVIDGQALDFDRIYALQVLEKLVSSNSTGAYQSYELNLVTVEGVRHNLLSHGDKELLLMDAEKVKGLLGVPVWTLISLI